MGSNEEGNVDSVKIDDGGDGNIEQEEAPLGFPITKEFLEFAFERGVKSFSVKVGTNPGDNYMSVMHAVELMFGGEQKPRHYLFKCYPTHPKRREILDQSNVFEKEMFLYEELLPTFNQLVKESEADEKIAGLSSSPFHGGNLARSPSNKWKDSQWARENFIIMTDLRKSQFVMADRMTGLDLEHAKLAMRELARWHALGWALKEKNGWTNLAEKYPNLVDQMYANNEQGMEAWKPFFDQVNGNALKMTEEGLGATHPAHLALKRVVDGDNVAKIMPKFGVPYGVKEEEYEDFLRIKPEEDEEYNKEPWLTGTHGDCWMNNMLFRYDSSGGLLKPVQVTFVDLQLYRETCPTVDLAYFLTTSVRAPVRIPGRDALLLAYHDAFVLACKELDVRPYPGFSMKSLKRRYRRSELFGLLMGLLVLTFVLKPAEEAVDMDKSVDGEVTESELFSNVMKDSDKNVTFKKELIPTVLDLYERGVI